MKFQEEIFNERMDRWTEGQAKAKLRNQTSPHFIIKPHNPKFFDRQAFVNGANPDQTTPSGAI